MDCQENEYWDQWGRCVTCQLCGPGQELSKDCGYGEGGDAHCTACPPRRYKSSWGHQRCQICITCAVINRIQKANCTATSNAVCGDCLPRFYQKTRIGGLQDEECIPCTRQTPTSEAQCAFRLSLVKADILTVPPQEATLVVLVSSLLMVFTLAFLGLFFLYRKQFFRHCHHVAGGSLQFEADEAAEEDSLFPVPPGQEASPESPLGESIFETQPLNPTLDDDRSSTRGFPTQESFCMSSCASESPSHWVHTPIECTELDLQKFSSSASSAGAETLGGNTAESSGDRLELNGLSEVPSPSLY
ncbi:tumor necrosis factor receptor superfamily member 27 isoform X1 [Rousettus aegyptiacus]|uniref:tumor necrosis factor receptor superfamily member 27 isoform X1 n=1 Tax=Rousettus aegyptiacus TaxID=9407 RepID=UPI00078837C4|nr:tumor necrosis factor receptor superfamily member 27 isoform X1 [Rousettus aegyptiacus]XP_016021783.1 tumor necrosis factor receptor superfamily member 27 isoform X1 [Rousettus aegyptiacus]XP_036083003.1 tumor necrosis factor receptor superfamily member 27 isoform X1 [Rousettus aegyptiacus]XP_036083004.1 tumor necrosis factor receptor superfamily member 27 isoform X1 [Rousettus aegyptiacus]XP_036083005.1 tumor necrosis factor receptor superfamily member 27 isoform X1 [Rousettus aegyptiacus]